MRAQLLRFDAVRRAAAGRLGAAAHTAAEAAARAHGIIKTWRSGARTADAYTQRANLIPRAIESVVAIGIRTARFDTRTLVEIAPLLVAYKLGKHRARKLAADAHARTVAGLSPIAEESVAARCALVQCRADAGSVDALVPRTWIAIVAFVVEHADGRLGSK